MSDFTVAIQCGSIGERCGIYTYSQRLEEYLNKNNVNAYMFESKIRRGWKKPDLVSIQYEPGMCPPQRLSQLLQMYKKYPCIVTVHHTGIIPRFYDKVDGIIFHDETQIFKDPTHGDPWDHVVIPHPALVYPEKDQKKLRKKYGIPIDKKVIGTSGFIAGTGKHIPEVVSELASKLNDDEFLYLITSFWKGGDFGFKEVTEKRLEKLGKLDQVKMDTEFVPAKVLNEKMQCCDFMFSWNDSVDRGSNSGAAMDMLGAHRRIIVKNVPHYNTPMQISGVLKGRLPFNEFVDDALNAFRTEDLSMKIDIEQYSWDNKIKDMIKYFEEFI